LAWPRDEAITAVPNVRVYRALREHMVELLRELKRIGANGTVDERQHEEIERLEREFVDLRGGTAADTVNTERLDILRMSRRQSSRFDHDGQEFRKSSSQALRRCLVPCSTESRASTSLRGRGESHMPSRGGAPLGASSERAPASWRSFRLPTLAGNRSGRKGREKLFRLDSKVYDRKTRALRVFARTLAPSANPGGLGATRHAKGAGPQPEEVITMEATIVDVQ
jgi:hypothetical protein